jgi:hypothetical protein
MHLKGICAYKLFSPWSAFPTFSRVPVSSCGHYTIIYRRHFTRKHSHNLTSTRNFSMSRFPVVEFTELYSWHFRSTPDQFGNLAKNLENEEVFGSSVKTSGSSKKRALSGGFVMCSLYMFPKRVRRGRFINAAQ